MKLEASLMLLASAGYFTILILRFQPQVEGKAVVQVLRLTTGAC